MSFGPAHTCIAHIRECPPPRPPQTVHSFLFCTHFKCMNCITKLILLVSCSVSSKQQLCFVYGLSQNHTTKNFVWFYNHLSIICAYGHSGHVLSFFQAVAA